MKNKTRCRACAADDADIGVFDHGIPHDLEDGCDLTEGDLCEYGDGRVGNHVFHARGQRQVPVRHTLARGVAWP